MFLLKMLLKKDPTLNVVSVEDGMDRVLREKYGNFHSAVRELNQVYKRTEIIAIRKFSLVCETVCSQVCESQLRFAPSDKVSKLTYRQVFVGAKLDKSR